MKITTIGLDLAKSVFDATGQVVVRKSLRRSQMLAFFVNRRSNLTPYRRPILTPLIDGFWR